MTRETTTEGASGVGAQPPADLDTAVTIRSAFGHAWNLYINRHTTGAVVRRQPFGGWKRSSVGPGAKASGPYVASLGRWESERHPDPTGFQTGVRAALTTELAPADPSRLAAEANVLRYVPLTRLLLRAGAAVTDGTVHLALAAACAVGVTTGSRPAPRPGLDAIIESDDTLAAQLEDLSGLDKLRPPRRRRQQAPPPLPGHRTVGRRRQRRRPPTSKPAWLETTLGRSPSCVGAAHRVNLRADGCGASQPRDGCLSAMPRRGSGFDASNWRV